MRGIRNGMLDPMAGTYKITATPSLYCEGEYRGKLKSVLFRAVSPTDVRQWLAKNCGQFETAFGRIMPARLAGVIVDSLLRGDEVELPGLYAEHEFERGF